MKRTSQPLWLPGYRPLSLAHYLKALAVLRLLSQQPDPNITGSRKREVLLLTSPKLEQKNTMNSLALHPGFLRKWRMLWRIYFRPERLRGWKDFWSLPPVVKPEADDDV